MERPPLLIAPVEAVEAKSHTAIQATKPQKQTFAKSKRKEVTVVPQSKAAPVSKVSLSTGMIALAFLCSSSIPANAATTDTFVDTNAPTTQTLNLKTVPESQTYTVSDTVSDPTVQRDSFGATSQADLDAANAAKAKAEADKKAAEEAAKKAAEAAVESAKIQQTIKANTQQYANNYATQGAQQQKLNLSTDTTPEKAAYVNLALQHVGVPYVFGGATPNGWDCSGFTLWVYQQQTGITMPHSVPLQQDGYTKPVSYQDAQPGDLVFFKDGSGSRHHVGIYLGNGMMIHAPKPGDRTKIAPIWWSENVTFGSLY
jgi:cell wall-associated NlpC family hydrolase